MLKRATLIALAAVVVSTGLPLQGSLASVAAATTSKTTISANKPTTTTSTSSQYFEATKPKSVYLTNNSYLRYRSIDLVDGEQGKALVFSFTVYNNDTKVINMLDYWYKVVDKSGASFKLKPAETNPTDIISPKTRKDFTFYAEVDRGAKLSDLKIEVIKWDFNAPNYERRFNSYSIPSTYNNIAPNGKLQKVQLGSHMFDVRLNKGTLSESGSNRVVRLNWEVQNTGVLQAKIGSTEFVVKTKEGYMYPAVLETPLDAVSPRSKESLQLIATVPNGVSLDGAILIWQQQPEKSTYSFPISKHRIVLSEEVQQVGDKLNLVFDSQKVVAAPVELISTALTDKLSKLLIKYDLLNNGKQSAKVGKLEFEYKSPNNKVYPIKVVDDSDITISPGITKTLALEAEIPATELKSRGQLFVYQTIVTGEKTSRKLLGKHVVQTTTNTVSEIPFGSKHSYRNTNGLYEMVVDKIYRNPWDSEDLVQVEVELKNAEKKTGNIAVPNLEAAFYIDGSKLEGAIDIVRIGQPVGLGKGESQKYLLVTKIPHTQDFNKLNVELKEKIGENSVFVGNFTQTGKITQLVSKKPGEATESIQVDRKSSLTVQSVRAYTGRTTDMLYVDISLKNAGNRKSQLGNWVGYFRNKEGLIFPATIVETEDTVSPFGTVSTYAYTKIPKNVGFTDFELLIGEGVSEGKFIKPGAAASAYVYPVSYAMKLDTTAPSTSLENLELAPYSLTFKNILAAIYDERSFSLSFNYDLLQERTAEIDLTKHELIVELLDANGQSYETKLELDKDIKFGRGLSKSITFEDNNLFMNVPSFQGYKLRVYDVVDGHKRLIGERTLEWMSRSS